MSSLKKNIGYQSLYQILNTCLPLITSPYLSRVLNADGLGIFSYTQSIVNYFALFAILGTITYGTRTISFYLNDIERRSIEFWNIYALQFITGGLMICAYMGYMLATESPSLLLSCMQGIYLLGTLLDINWCFFGVQNFHLSVKIGILTRILSVVALLGFVNGPDDVWIYAAIVSSTFILNNLIPWFFIKDVVMMDKINSISLNQIRKHVKPNIVLFVPVLTMSIYHIMDKTMLGLLSTFQQCGYYYNADKIINIPVGILFGIGNVLLPRTTYLYSIGDKKGIENNFNISLELLGAVSIAMAFGTSAISKEFIPFFFGPGYDECIYLTIVLSPVLLIKGISSIARYQFLIPCKKENIFIQSVFLGSLANILVNLVLINKLGALGAVIGTLIAELIACVWQFIKMKEFINYTKGLKSISMYFTFGVIMFYLVRFGSGVFKNLIITLIGEITIGIVVYSILCMIYWSIFRKDILKIIFNR